MSIRNYVIATESLNFHPNKFTAYTVYNKVLWGEMVEKNLIIVGSVTYAMKSKEILFSNGIKSYIERNKKTKEYGCGYGVHVVGNIDEAIFLLRKNGIKILAMLEKEAK